MVAALCILSGCATLGGSKRVLIGAMGGAALGGTGGALLSPNDESRGLNTLVFGLSGALVGGAIALLTSTDPGPSAAVSDLKSRELGSGGLPGTAASRNYFVLPSQDLPAFLKNRVQPVVIEEFQETDRVTDEGTLHEPHRAYRIKRPAELFAQPIQPKTGE